MKKTLLALVVSIALLIVVPSFAIVEGTKHKAASVVRYKIEL